MYLLGNTTHRMMVRYNSKIGYLYVPNQIARIPHERGSYFVRTNKLGFRSDIEFEKEQGKKPRILFFGDSLTAGDGCCNHERFAEQAGEILGAEVYNFGIPGSGTDQHLLVFEEFCKDIKADFVVICVYVENIERIKAAYRTIVERATRRKLLIPKPYFILDEHNRLNLLHSPVPIERPDKNSSGGLRVQPENAPRSSTPSLNLCYNIIDAASKSAFFNRWAQFFSPARAEDFNMLRSIMLRMIGFQPYRDYRNFQSDGCRLMEAILKRFIDSVNGLPALIVPLPGDHHYLDRVRPIYQTFFQGLEPYAPNTYVADITTALSKLPLKERKKLRFSCDYHFSPFGHRKIAEEIVKNIQAHKLLPVQPAKANTTVTLREDSIYVLGISCFYHNSAASLIKDGKIIAAAEEERFTRLKNDRRFPVNAINFCLEQARINASELQAVVYYDCIQLTFERLMKTAVESADLGLDLWKRMLPSWLQYKLYLPNLIRQTLKYDGAILQNIHHRSHAASTFFPSPFKEAAIITVDGVGEWATATIGVGNDNKMDILKEMVFPNSLGLLYSAFTQFIGFKVNSGEYKMMGLAPYGRPIYVDRILKHLINLKEDGSIELNMEYFAFLSQPTMINEKFEMLFDGPARKYESNITQREMDIARSIQWITEEVILKMTKEAKRLTGQTKLCLAGGVALNCVANGRVLREGPFEDIWIQPAAGDSGASLGAALDVYYTCFKKTRIYAANGRSIQGGSYLGPEFSDEEITAFLETYGYSYKKLSTRERSDVIAQALAQGKVVGHFAGRAEFGPRALGSRSILADPRNPEMQVTLNIKIKYRESFRPFAPTVLVERIEEYFELDRESPYMLVVAPVKKERRLAFERGNSENLLEIIRNPRSDIPAVTHIDYSARIQSITRDDHPVYYDVVKAFEKQTGCAAILNTSFNIRGEPIVNTPYDAYRCFMQTEMDILILGNNILFKDEQPRWLEEKGRIDEYKTDGIEAANPKLIAALIKIFKHEFLPFVHNLKKIDGYRWLLRDFNKAQSNWVDYKGARLAEDIFEFPKPMLQQDGSVNDLAKAILSRWSDLDFADMFLPVMISLLKVSQRVKTDTIVNEEVPDSNYVMF